MLQFSTDIQNINKQMKTTNILLCIILLVSILACDKENNAILPSSFHYISFDVSEIKVREGSSETVKVKFMRSSEVSNSDLVFNYTTSFPEGKQQAEVNTDYTLSDSSGSIVLPAGVNEVEVELLTVADNSNSVGNRYITFNLTSQDGLKLGSPGNTEAKSVTVIIEEDDLATFAYTSFEEVPAFVGDIYYNKSGTAELNNTQISDPNSTDPYVDFIATGQELGFDSSFITNDVGDSGVESIGVFKNENLETAPDDFEARFTKGNQGFITSDLDGTLEIVFDKVENIHTKLSGVVIEASIYFGNTGYEEGDGIEIFYKNGEDLGAPVISYVFKDIVKSSWINASGVIPTDRLQPGNIVVRMKNGANSEMIFLDYVAIKGIP